VSADPTETDPDKYKVVFENDRVRVLEYRDKPGDRTSPHRHPDSVMYTLGAFERRLIKEDQQRDVVWPSIGRVGGAVRSTRIRVRVPVGGHEQFQACVSGNASSSSCAQPMIERR